MSEQLDPKALFCIVDRQDDDTALHVFEDDRLARAYVDDATEDVETIWVLPSREPDIFYRLDTLRGASAPRTLVLHPQALERGLEAARKRAFGKLSTAEQKLFDVVLKPNA